MLTKRFLFFGYFSAFTITTIVIVIFARLLADPVPQQRAASSTAPIIQFNPYKKGINFIVVGDWGRNGDYNQTEVADQMNKYAKENEVKFIISTGDNFYDNGVRSVDDPLWTTSFENIYHGANLQIDWYVVLGNHDYHGNPQAEVDYTKKSRRWNMPSRYYSVTKEIDKNDSVELVFTDSSPFVTKYHENKWYHYGDLIQQDTAKQMQWMDNTLASSKAQWKFVFGHHPIYSNGSNHGNTPELIKEYKPILEKDHVQAYMCGHEHLMQHLKFDGDPIDYFISGAGSETEKPETTAQSKFSSSSSGFAFVSLKADSMQLYFIDDKGNVLYKSQRAR